MFKTPMEVAVYQLHNFSISFFSSFVGGDVVSVKLDNSASGASVVAIDNKIEQAMDLVKNHLMYAVREEVEILKEQIKELAEKNSQLERENSLLKNLASPEQLEKFQLHLPSDVPALMENQQGVAETEASPHIVGSAVIERGCVGTGKRPVLGATRILPPKCGRGYLKGLAEWTEPGHPRGTSSASQNHAKEKEISRERRTTILPRMDALGFIVSEEHLENLELSLRHDC
ncbi:TSC22 domain family protein 3 [Acipenser ruthenus]|uniref:TSC22 domain family protein 3 n=1 Tax=Acipenser ruthenus TaxID=7906 RepID=A0A662YQ30_ACIRT|nr:TSC22 domain family protein 3 [Acipenser ruthenus]